MDFTWCIQVIDFLLLQQFFMMCSSCPAGSHTCAVLCLSPGQPCSASAWPRTEPISMPSPIPVIQEGEWQLSWNHAAWSSALLHKVMLDLISFVAVSLSLCFLLFFISLSIKQLLHFYSVLWKNEGWPAVCTHPWAIDYAASVINILHLNTSVLPSCLSCFCCPEKQQCGLFCKLFFHSLRSQIHQKKSQQV